MAFFFFKFRYAYHVYVPPTYQITLEACADSRKPFLSKNSSGEFLEIRCWLCVRRCRKDSTVTWSCTDSFAQMNSHVYAAHLIRVTLRTRASSGCSAGCDLRCDEDKGFFNDSCRIFYDSSTLQCDPLPALLRRFVWDSGRSVTCTLHQRNY